MRLSYKKKLGGEYSFLSFRGCVRGCPLNRKRELVVVFFLDELYGFVIQKKK